MMPTGEPESHDSLTYDYQQDDPNDGLIEAEPTGQE